MALSPPARRALEFGASEVLFDVHRMLMQTEPTADEPRHVCVMTQLGSLLLYHAWEGILAQAGIQLRVTGVYCHQTPKAHFTFQGGKAAPELGDLLIVHEHLHPTSPRRRALLVQAKMAAGGKPTGAPNKPQEHLYEHWPDFRLRGHGGRGKSARFLDGNRRLKPNRRGSTYALIEDAGMPIGIHGHLRPSVWRFAKPNGKGQGRHAALTLSDMVLGRSGAGRRASIPTGSLADPNEPGYLAPNNPRDFHWSATVQELINVTAGKTLSANMQGPLVPDRGITFGFMQSGPSLRLAGSGDLFDGGRGDIPAEVVEEEPEDGISIILIETSGDGLDEPVRG